MDSSDGQAKRTSTPEERTAASAATRERLIAAAAELIAEVGWGRVTTRGVAARAKLPHGAVSYHFRGKQDLLIEAAMGTFEAAIPMEAFERLTTVNDLIGLIDAEVGNREAIDPTLSGLMVETMCEAGRDPVLRERLGELLGRYRERMVEVVAAEQKSGAAFGGAPPAALATLLGAAGDGLLLHVLLDPELDPGSAIEALRALLRGGR